MQSSQTSPPAPDLSPRFFRHFHGGLVNDLKGRWLFHKRRYELAEKQYAAAAIAYPKNSVFRERLATAKERLGKFGECESLLRELNLERPHDATIANNFARILAGRSKLDEARDRLLVAIAGNQKSAKLHKAIAAIFGEMGDLAGAHKHFNTMFACSRPTFRDCAAYILFCLRHDDLGAFPKSSCPEWIKRIYLDSHYFFCRAARDALFGDIPGYSEEY
ncbi:MAG: hypothetical protein LBJ46_09620, partial [Planctomycetota bacterium]|nr:hypothetical protein [Planctomycetota bacterium]